MSEFEANGFRGLWLPGRRLDGDFGVAVIAKRRFVVELSSAACVADEEPPPIVMAAEHREPDAPMSSSVLLPSDIALSKQKVDVIVQGNAHAPGGKPKRSFDVRVRIAGVLDRALRIVGPREVTWVAPKKKLTKKQRANGERQPYPDPKFGQARTITSLPLTYEYAYGGSGALLIDAHLAEAAEAHQEEAKQAEARRERKQEIEAELKADQAAANAEAAAEKDAEAGGLAAVSDEKAKERFAEAFDGADGESRDGVRVLDDAELARLEMEEADALCSSIGIIAAGQLRCIGSNMHLKSKFGDHVKVDIVTAPTADMGAVEAFMTRAIPGATREAAFGQSSTYTVTRAAAPISQIFASMNDRPATLGIVDWGLRQTSLEEVFLKIAEQAAAGPGATGARGLPTRQASFSAAAVAV